MPARPNRRAGFVLIFAAMGLLIIFGMLGLCIDLARMQLAKNELQAFTDAAVLSAIQMLDGTDQGVTRARGHALAYPNNWDFTTRRPANIIVEFATAAAGPWTDAPPSPPTNYRYARVSAEGQVPMYFFPVFRGLDTLPAGFLLVPATFTGPVLADSTAGQLKINRFSENLLPYSPDAHLDAAGLPLPAPPGWGNPADPFNFVVGKRYTMRWSPPGPRNVAANNCEGDWATGYKPVDSASQRGFIDIGDVPGSGGSAFIRQAIISNVQTHDLAIGDLIVNVTGNRGTESEALRDRVNQDEDYYSLTYTEYMANQLAGERVGNGRRIVYMPVNNSVSDRVIDFAAFFLPIDTEVCGASNVAGCCAEYIGPGLLTGYQGGGGPAGVYAAKLIE